MRHRQQQRDPVLWALLAQVQGRRGALRQAQGVQLPQGLALQQQLIPPLLGQLQGAIEVQAHPLARQGQQQVEGGQLTAALQQPVHGLAQLGSRLGRRIGAAIAGAEQLGQFVEQLLAGPAAQQLLSKALVAQQGRPQQLHQIASAAPIEQVQPGRQIVAGLLGGLAPGLQLLQIHRQHQPVELQFEHFGGPHGGHRQRRRPAACEHQQQTGKNSRATAAGG